MKAYILKLFRANKDIYSLISLAVIVFVSRIPFLTPGYGFDFDAWLVFRAARYIALHGTYVVSRVEGHPVQEYAYSLFYWSGPIVLNGTTALFSVAAAVLFALILRKLNIKYYFLGGLTLAFIPVVYINSCNTMDYVWALALILGAFYALMNNTIGEYNSAVGSNALSSNTTGHSNSAVGGSALSSNTTASYNSAMGSGALQFNTIGEFNSALGFHAQRRQTYARAPQPAGLCGRAPICLQWTAVQSRSPY